MLFVKYARPDIYEKTYQFLTVLDYINLRLTGRFCATQDSIRTSWVTDNRNADAIAYDARLIAASGIDAAKFPELVRGTDVLGPILPQVAQALGLSSSTPVVARAIDNSAAAVGAGTYGDGQAHLYMGSSSWIAAHVPHQKTSLSDQIAAVPCAVPSKYLMMAMQSCGAANIAFLKDRIAFHDDGLHQGEPSAQIYDILSGIAERTPEGAEGMVYFWWLFGERSPVDNPRVRAGIFNMTMGHNRETLVRVVFEGVALNTRWMMRPVAKFLGAHLADLTIIDGGARSDARCQIFADVLGLPIRQPHQPIASAVASLDENLSWPQGRDPVQFGRHIALVRYRPSGTGMLVSAFTKALRDDVYAYLMASHGVICAAAHLDAAFALIRAVDDAAATYLRGQPRGIAPKNMPKILAYFDEKCGTSKALATRAKAVILGGVQHNLAFNYPFPLAAAKVEGANMWDEYGNRYVDFLQAGGPTVLGSNYAPVGAKVDEVIATCGPVTGLLHVSEIQLAKVIRHYMPNVEMFRMLGSGTEAVMGAIRLARANTGKTWVIKLGGGYHGWSDQMVYGMHVPGTGRREASCVVPQAIPKRCSPMSWAPCAVN